MEIGMYFYFIFERFSISGKVTNNQNDTLKTLDNISIAITTFSFLFYCYLMDPFRWRSGDRNHRRMLVNSRYAKVIYTIAFLIFFGGFLKVFFSDRITIAFASVPLLFVFLIKVAHQISLKYYNRKFFLIVSGDSVKGKSLFQITTSILVICLPIFIPILYLLFFRMISS